MSEEQKDIPVNGAQEQSAPVEERAETLENGTPTSSAEGLQARIIQLERESEDYRDKWLRAVADYKNFKRRAEQERAELIRGASAGLLLKLLPVVDDIERAAASAPAERILESEGVTAIAALGQEFDPNQHEAVIYEDTGDGSDGRVVAELQKGYKLRDRVLRPTMVKVGKA